MLGSVCAKARIRRDDGILDLKPCLEEIPIRAEASCKSLINASNAGADQSLSYLGMSDQPVGFLLVVTVLLRRGLGAGQIR